MTISAPIAADSPTDFRATAQAILAATAAEDLFGDLGATRQERLSALATAFRRIARAVHPDLHGSDPARPREAHAVFVKASALRDAAERAIHAGSYGDRRPVSSAPEVVATRRRAYRIEHLVARGDLSDLYACSWEDPKRGIERALFKIVSCPGDNDLLESEASVLRRLFPTREPEVKFLRYLPRLIDSFTMQDEDVGVHRRVVVVPHFAEHRSLSDVLAVYRDGIDFRDAVWMVKRLLVVLGWVHRRGVVHGAIVPPHLLVHPVDHGARLVDWCYAVPIGGRVRALSVAHRDLYAPEITSKQPVSAQTDIYMAARCALLLMGATAVPPALRRFFETCLTRSPARRPDDAWKLHDELDELLVRLVGKPTYRRLEMPRTD